MKARPAQKSLRTTLMHSIEETLRDMDFSPAQIEYCLKHSDIFEAVDDIYLSRVHIGKPVNEPATT